MSRNRAGSSYLQRQERNNTMKMLINWLIIHLFFGGTLFFAAGAPPLTGDIADGGDAGDGSGDLDYGADDDAGDDADAGDEDVDAGQGDEDADADQNRARQEDDKEEPEVKEFKGAVSQRLLRLKKEAPELAQVFQKYPKVQEQIEATFRREAALREVFPTVAEARQMREQFPNGLADVQSLHESVKEVETLDKNLYTRDRDGNFPGHTAIVENIFRDDRDAAISLFKTLPKQWAALDRDSYNEVMGKIVSATITGAGVVEHIAEMMDAAKEAKNDGLAKGLGQLLNWAKSYSKEKPQPSPDEERLRGERATFTREKQERDREEGQKFHNNFVTQSRKLQQDVIKTHPAVKRVMDAKNVTPQKKAEIVEKVRKSIESFLGKSPSFMGKLNPAYKGRNLDETLKVQKAQWSQQWLLNRMVRSVLNDEVPQMVSNNREAVRRRGGAPPAKSPANKSADRQETKHTKPYQEGKNWFWPNGTRMSIDDILRGKHEQA